MTTGRSTTTSVPATCPNDNALHQTDGKIMLDAVTKLLNDPFWQSMLFSPVIGALFGVLFSGMNSAPPSHQQISIQQTRQVFVKTIHHHHYHGGGKSGPDDGMAILFAIIAVCAIIVYGYAAYSTEMLRYLTLAWLFGLAFVVATTLGSAWKGHFTSPEWVFHALAPVVVLFASGLLIDDAYAQVIPGAREVAHQAGNPFTFFFKHLNDAQRIWMLYQLLGLLLLAATVIGATLSSLYYLALMNQRSASGVAGFWRILTRLTQAARGWPGLLLIIGSLVLAYLAVEGNLYAWWGPTRAR